MTEKSPLADWWRLNDVLDDLFSNDRRHFSNCIESSVYRVDQKEYRTVVTANMRGYNHLLAGNKVTYKTVAKLLMHINVEKYYGTYSRKQS